MWRRGNASQKQHLVRSVGNVLTTNARLSYVLLLIGSKFIPITRVLRKRAIEGSALADFQESSTGDFKEEFVLTVKRQQNLHHWLASVGITQPCVELIPTTPQNNKPDYRKKSLAFHSSKKGLFDDAQREFCPFGFAAKAPFKKRVFMNRICNARRPTKISNLRVANIQPSVFAFQQVTMTPASHHAHSFFTTEEVEMIRRIIWNQFALESELVIFLKLLSSSVGKQVDVCPSSRYGASFFSWKKAEIIYSSSAVQPGWAKPSAILKKIFTHLRGLSVFFIESFLSNLTSFNRPFYVGKPSVLTKTDLYGTQSSVPMLLLWTIAASMKLCNMLASRLFGRRRCFRMDRKKTRAMCDICIKWIAALLNMDGGFDSIIWISGSGHCSLLKEWSSVPESGHIDTETVTLDSCLWLFIINIAKEQASAFAFACFQVYVFLYESENRSWARTL